MMMTTAKVNGQTVAALQGVNKVMVGVNETMNMNQMRDICKEFAKESGKMENNAEIMADQMDMMNPAGTEDDADEVYNQILGDIGMGLNKNIGAGD
jgi:hypothetical protein